MDITGNVFLSVVLDECISCQQFILNGQWGHVWPSTHLPKYAAALIKYIDVPIHLHVHKAIHHTKQTINLFDPPSQRQPI